VPTNYFGAGRIDPDYADLIELPRLQGVLNRLNRVYGSHKQFPIWNTEYGYRTRPPDPHAGVSLSTQPLWMNWAEYLSYLQPGTATFNQYLLQDPAGGVFASGLEFPNGGRKPSFDAFRLPMYLPSTSTGQGGTLEVWGDVRPAHFFTGPETVQIQFQGGYTGSAWITLETVPVTNPQGYFIAHVGPPTNGLIRLSWSPPSGCPDTGVASCPAEPIYLSRTQSVTVH
jgi:hypothetical protein